jgi:hypothetical protein
LDDVRQEERVNNPILSKQTRQDRYVQICANMQRRKEAKIGLGEEMGITYIADVSGNSGGSGVRVGGVGGSGGGGVKKKVQGKGDGA